MEEGMSNVIKMPEDDPKAFEDILGYLYMGEVSLKRYNAKKLRKGRNDVRAESIGLYSLAEKLGYEQLQNLWMEMHWEYGETRLADEYNLGLLENIPHTKIA
jgi:hypothetical protein